MPTSRAEAVAARLSRELGPATFTAGAPASLETPDGFWLVAPRRGKRGLWHTVTLNWGVPPRRELMRLPWGLLRLDRDEPLRWAGRTNRRGQFTVRGPAEGTYRVRYVAAAADDTDRAILARVAERRAEVRLHARLRKLLGDLRVEDAPVGQFAARPLVALLERSLGPAASGSAAFYERVAGAVELLLRHSRRPDRAGTTLAGGTQTRLNDELRPLSAPERELLDTGTEEARVYRLARLAGRSEVEIAGLLGLDCARVAWTLSLSRAYANLEKP